MRIVGIPYRVDVIIGKVDEELRDLRECQLKSWKHPEDREVAEATEHQMERVKKIFQKETAKCGDLSCRQMLRLQVLGNRISEAIPLVPDPVGRAEQRHRNQLGFLKGL